MTPQEVKLWTRLRLLRALGFHFPRQVPIDRFIVDFACLKQRLIVEVDGGQHGIAGHMDRDQERDRHLEQLDFRVVRSWNVDVDRNLDGVVETIVAHLTAAQVPTPDASRRTLPSGEG